MSIKHFVFLSLLLITSGCKFSEPDLPPQIDMPCEWKNNSIQEEHPETVQYWWEIFHDDQLNQLEQIAIERNQIIFGAVSRVKEARYMAMATRADLFPLITTDPNYMETRQLVRFSVPPVIPNSPKFVVYRNVIKQYTFPITLNYEADLWGRFKYGYEAASLEADAVEAALYGSLLSLTTELAEDYYQLRSYDTQIDILKSTIKTRKEAVDILSQRYDAGLINYLDVTQAKVELRNAEVELINVERNRALVENAIALLIGDSASDFTLSHNPLGTYLPRIPAGIPSEVLERRPDIRQARKLLESQMKEVLVAKTAFLPSIHLTGAFGYSGPFLKKLISPHAHYEMVAAFISQIIFDGGRIASNYRASLARFEEAASSYFQQVLVAFQDVENALSNIEYFDKELEALTLLVEASQESYDISTQRYQSGLTDFLDVVNAERSLLNSRRTKAQIQANQYIGQVELIRAIGGTWNNIGQCDSCDEDEIIVDNPLDSDC
ncbi:Outer membrane protein OprM precursor [Candidatus Rubidus massiliensis]|nr:Outer membrane protein OprM precursor [Candidatus Rubidus massiliensis]